MLISAGTVVLPYDDRAAIYSTVDPLILLAYTR